METLKIMSVTWGSGSLPTTRWSRLLAWLTRQSQPWPSLEQRVADAYARGASHERANWVIVVAELHARLWALEHRQAAADTVCGIAADGASTTRNASSGVSTSGTPGTISDAASIRPQ
jgi:hypothetical protein